MGLEDAVQGHRVYLDTNVLIYALEGHSRYARVLGGVFDRIDAGALEAVTSELSLCEALVKPMSMGNEGLTQRYLDFLQPSSSLSVIPVSRRVLVEAARLRAQVRSLRTPDAIHAATARLIDCGTLLTNDASFRALPDLRVVLCSDFA